MSLSFLRPRQGAAPLWQLVLVWWFLCSPVLWMWPGGRSLLDTVVSALLGRRAYGHFRQPVAVALNRRAHMLVGSTHLLSTPFLDGAGRLTLGGTPWTINGPDLPTGARVRIVGVDGAVLKVEKIEA